MYRDTAAFTNRIQITFLDFNTNSFVESKKRKTCKLKISCLIDFYSHQHTKILK